jgi:hypothetical protein
MTLPTEPIGSIPRPPWLIEAIAATDGLDPALDTLYDEAIRDTLARFEATGSPDAFAKIRSQVEGTPLASKILGGG